MDRETVTDFLLFLAALSVIYVLWRISEWNW
jgi:hypothetical protein